MATDHCEWPLLGYHFARQNGDKLLQLRVAGYSRLDQTIHTILAAQSRLPTLYCEESKWTDLYIHKYIDSGRT